MRRHEAWCSKAAAATQNPEMGMGILEYDEEVHNLELDDYSLDVEISPMDEVCFDDVPEPTGPAQESSIMTLLNKYQPWLEVEL